MRSAGVLPVRRLRSRSSHWGPAGALSDTWAPSSRVHLAATPRQRQPLDPAFQCSRSSSSQPTRRHSVHPVLQGRKPSAVPTVTSAPAPSPPWRCEFQQQTQASRCRLCHFAKGGSEKEQNKGRGPRKQIQITRRKRSQKKKKKAIKASPSLSSTTSRCTVRIH